MQFAKGALRARCLINASSLLNKGVLREEKATAKMNAWGRVACVFTKGALRARLHAHAKCTLRGRHAFLHFAKGALRARCLILLKACCARGYMQFC